MNIKLTEHNEHGAAIELDGKVVAVLRFCNHDDIPALRAEVIKRCNAYERMVAALLGMTRGAHYDHVNQILTLRIEADALYKAMELLAELEGK